MGVLATDNFNRADENPLSDGGNWTTMASHTAWEVVSNQAEPAVSGDDCCSLYTGVSWPNDQYGQVVIAAYGAAFLNETGIGIALRAANANNFYRIVVGNQASNNVTVAKIVSGSYSVITQITEAFALTDVLKVEVQSNTLRVYRNGVQFGGDISGDASLTSGDVGLFNSGPTSATAALDSFEGGDFATPPITGAPVYWIRA